MKLKMKASILEGLGQLRIPGIDALRSLISPWTALIADVKTAMQAKITATAKSITIRIGRALLMISKEDCLVDDVQAEITGLDEGNAIDTLLGFGFELKGMRA